MKKTLKAGKKTVSKVRTTQKIKKIEVKTVKTPKKRQKPANSSVKTGARRRYPTRHSDTQKAFFLAGLLIIVSICIAAFVLNVYPPEIDDIDAPSFVVEKPNPAVSETPAQNKTSDKPAISVSVEKPAQNETASSARTTPSTNTTHTTPATKTTTTTRTTTVTNTNTAARTTSPAKTTPASAPPQRPVENLGTLVFMIDDAGNNLRELDPFLRIQGPLTIAVLPGLPNSAEAARRIRAAGKEVFLHQPMEALGAQNPGPGAIYSGMSSEEIRAILKRNIAEVGPVTGINNHQGSKITMDREAMKTILAFCAENKLLFLDSRTTADTVAPDVARQLGMKIGERNIFLDNEQDKASMLRYIEGGQTRAQKNGSAVMIGHTWSPELAPLLAEQIPVLTKQGYSIKTASEIIR